MSLYLVTGGGGFVGSNIVHALVERGEQVRVFDNFTTGRRENLAAVGQDAEIIEGDIRSYHLVQQAVQGVDFVLHQAALPSVPRSVRDPITTNEVNVLGTLNVLQAAREAGVKRLVYASSSSVYGGNVELPKRESMCPRPLSPYAISKLAAEQYCQAFWSLYGFETVCLRYFNVFGPRQDPNSQYSAVIPRFVTAMLAGSVLYVHGDGTQSRDFTFVENVVQANLLACTAEAAPGRVYNVACGVRYPLLEVIAQLARITGNEPRIEYKPPRLGDVLHSLADIAAIRADLGYEPRVDLAEGLRRVVEWYQKDERAR